MVTVSEVRSQLADLSTTLISDTTVQQQIDLASTYIDAIKSETADPTLVEKAKLILATYYTYVAYVEIIHREIGDVPVSSRIQLNTLKDQANRLISLISSPGAASVTEPNFALAPLIETSDSVVEDLYVDP